MAEWLKRACCLFLPIMSIILITLSARAVKLPSSASSWAGMPIGPHGLRLGSAGDRWTSHHRAGVPDVQRRAGSGHPPVHVRPPAGAGLVLHLSSSRSLMGMGLGILAWSCYVILLGSACLPYPDRLPRDPDPARPATKPRRHNRRHGPDRHRRLIIPAVVLGCTGASPAYFIQLFLAGQPVQIW